MKNRKPCRHHNASVYAVTLRHAKYRNLTLRVLGLADSVTDAEQRALRRAGRSNEWGCEHEMFAEKVEYLGTLEY